MLRVAIGVALALALCVVVVIVIGYLLPVHHVAARVINLRRKPEEVFSLISNIQAAATWRVGVKKVELLSGSQSPTRFREVTDDGTITYEITGLKPPARMVTKISDPNLPFGGSWIYEISPTQEGCRLNITESGEVYNPVFRFLSRLVLGYNGSLDKYLKSVSRKFRDDAQPSEGVPATGDLNKVTEGPHNP
jgi:hypothetical protein